MSEPLPNWTIFCSPEDYPGFFVARLFLDDRPTDRALFAPSLEALRAKLPPGLYRLPRSPADALSVVETWL